MPTYEFPRPGLTADTVVVRGDGAAREILLVRRANEPHAGRWALPGGYVEELEPLEVAARRELVEETGLVVGRMRQVGVFGDPGRDPRGWTVTVAFLARADADATPIPGDDAAEAAWFAVSELPPLAFDHADIVRAALRGLDISHPVV